jgi:hypothetical protein
MNTSSHGDQSVANDDGWVYEQAAIDTLLALKGLREGDEIKFKHDQWKLHTVEAGVVMVVHSLPDEQAWWGDAPRPMLTCRASFGTWNSGGVGIIRDNIAAWRRPNAPKKS